MQFTESLRQNREFKRVYNKGKYYATPLFVFYYVKNGKDVNRLGITVSKKVGKAVQRNRAKRIIKEAYRHLEPKIRRGYDIVIVARQKTPFTFSGIIERALLDLLKQRGLTL